MKVEEFLKKIKDIGRESYNLVKDTMRGSKLEIYGTPHKTINDELQFYDNESEELEIRDKIIKGCELDVEEKLEYYFPIEDLKKPVRIYKPVIDGALEIAKGTDNEVGGYAYGEIDYLTGKRKIDLIKILTEGDATYIGDVGRGEPWPEEIENRRKIAWVHSHPFDKNGNFGLSGIDISTQEWSQKHPLYMQALLLMPNSRGKKFKLYVVENGKEVEVPIILYK